VIHLWDVRQGKSVRSVFGPHVAGDSIDYKNGEILIGCYAAKNQIQIWDYNKFTMREGITWSNNNEKDKVAYVYAASFA
jgi:WD40 repeat protein